MSDTKKEMAPFLESATCLHHYWIGGNECLKCGHKRTLAEPTPEPQKAKAEGRKAEGRKKK